ncbi:nestin, isoform CRA_a [Rattus norvegicus]|uniref:Nestin n=1 Tax=Rattus norvegicus TaxID=10116 RepID=A6J641_RAT|nr:nestin, isoform CRA_a [Rattus norvegicus]
MEGCVGEESFQMWELNRRLEAYLTRVKTLEEQNQLLSAELGGLRAQSGDTSWRARADDELASLRILVDQRWREKLEAEVQRDNLAEELESVAGRCQQVRLARERTVQEAACSRRALEAEKNARGWLSTQAAELERELEALRAAHEEERAHLNAQAACAPRRPPAPPHGSPVRAPEVEDLARRLGEVWRGAVRDYQERVAHMESSLGQARERLSQAVRGARECRLEVQQLQADRDSLQERREALEQRLEGRWQDRLQATDKFQLAVEALEQEKQGLQSQIAQILEGGQQLAHLKMSLSLEVATYRTLLEAENSRLQTPGRGSQASLGFLGYEEAEDQILERLIEKESQESLRSPEEEDQEAGRSLQKENQEPLGYEEAEDQMLERLIEKESQESLKSPEENQRIGKPLERENQKSLRYLEENQETFVPLESRNQRPLRSLEVEEEEQRIVKPLEKVSQDSLGSLAEENVQPLRYLEEDNCINKSLLEDKTHKSLGSLEDRNGDSIIIPQESETQVSLRPPEEEDQRIVNHLEKESQEFSRSSEEEEQVMERSLEGENHESLSSVEKEDQMVESQLEKESQDSGKSLEDESQETFGPLEKENAESLRSLAGQDQEEQKLEQETQQTLRAVGNEQMAVSPPEKVDPELPKPLGNDQEIARSLGKENQESLVSLKEKGIETVKSLETEIIEPLETAEEDLERRKSIDTQEPLWSTEVARETVEPPEDEPPGSLGSVDENRETLTSLEKESQELSSLGKWNVETRVEDSQQCLQVEEGLQEEQHQESLREVKQELPSSGNQQRWEDVVEGKAVGQEAPLATTGVGTEDKAELHLRGQGGEEEAAAEGELLQDIVGEAWSLGSSEPKEQRVPAEALDNLEGGALEVPVAQSMPEVTERDEDRAQAGEQDSIEVTLGLEAARTGLELEQEVVGLEDPRHFAREEAIPPSLGEESVKAKIAQGLEGPGKEPKEAGALDSGILELPKTSSEALECQGHEESESMEGWEEEEASLETSDHEGSDAPQPRPPETEEDEGAQAALTAPGPKLLEPCSPIPILTDAHELQPQAEGIQEAGWQPEAGSEALERVENEPEFGLGEIPEGLQDWEEGREESEADDLGETLPDSTPLGLYLRSPASPKWDLAGEQRLSPQGDAGKEDWGPAVPAAQGLSGPPEEEEEQGHGSDLSSEEFEDLGTEASLLPGVPKEVADHVGQVPPVLQPACWDQGGESDGFADEEESGEEGEEEDADEEGAESGAQWWGSGASGGGCKVQDIAQRGDPVQESVGVSGLWDDGLRGAAANVPALEMVSQDSAEPSGSEESESASLEGEEGQVTDHLDAPQEVTSMVPGVGDAFDIGGQSPNLDSEQVNGKMENGLEQAEGQVVLDGDEDQELLLQGQEVGALKVPLVASPVHLGPSQPLKFTLSGVDGDSWSSGED